jgi:RNA polymerase sigma-70 factor (ECF subfamily)
MVTPGFAQFTPGTSRDHLLCGAYSSGFWCVGPHRCYNPVDRLLLTRDVGSRDRVGADVIFPGALRYTEQEMEPDRLRGIVASAQRGSAEAYEALLDAYGRRLFAYFFRATGSYHDAEDLLAELMLRLVRRLKSYVDQGRFDQWLFRIAANMVRDRIRRRKAAPSVVSLDSETRSGATPGDRIAGRGPPVEAPLLAAEKLSAAMAKLDGVTRDMILLRHFGAMSFKEIAEIFQCPLGTALARVHRGVRTLRDLMGGEDEPQ